MLKIGVVGVGHLGKIHLNILSKHKKLNLLGIYDSNMELSRKIAKKFNIINYESFEKLLENVDVVDIVTPTPFHFFYAKTALKNNRHIFIEKPITANLEEAKTLIRIANKKKLKIQVGHVERFNPAFTAIQDKIKNPIFFEIHRLSQFSKRGTEVSVILDLMIHDIDIILNTVKSKIKTIHATGIRVLSKTPDIANARIEFKNGCVANLTASRISMKKMRKTRIFQKNTYISVDYLNKASEIVSVSDKNFNPFSITIKSEGEKRKITLEKVKIKDNNAIREELNSFEKSITNDCKPKVSAQDGYKALKVAYKIMSIIKQ